MVVGIVRTQQQRRSVSGVNIYWEKYSEQKPHINRVDKEFADHCREIALAGDVAAPAHVVCALQNLDQMIFLYRGLCDLWKKKEKHEIVFNNIKPRLLFMTWLNDQYDGLDRSLCALHKRACMSPKEKWFASLPKIDEKKDIIRAYQSQLWQMCNYTQNMYDIDKFVEKVKLYIATLDQNLPKKKEGGHIFIQQVLSNIVTIFGRLKLELENDKKKGWYNAIVGNVQEIRDWLAGVRTFFEKVQQDGFFTDDVFLYNTICELKSSFI